MVLMQGQDGSDAGSLVELLSLVRPVSTFSCDLSDLVAFSGMSEGRVRVIVSGPQGSFPSFLEPSKIRAVWQIRYKRVAMRICMLHGSSPGRIDDPLKSELAPSHEKGDYGKMGYGGIAPLRRYEQ